MKGITSDENNVHTEEASTMMGRRCKACFTARINKVCKKKKRTLHTADSGFIGLIGFSRSSR